MLDWTLFMPIIYPLIFFVKVEIYRSVDIEIEKGDYTFSGLRSSTTVQATVVTTHVPL
jgi:hypothetical protein